MTVRTTVVQGQIVNPLTNRVVANKRLSVRLNPDVVYSADGTQQIIRSSWITTDATGNFSEAFGVNADYDPAGSYYTVQVAPGLIDSLIVTYSASPVTYRSCLVSNPANPNPIQAGISQAQLDALSDVYVPQIPTVGGYTYDSSGRVTADPDGNTYTYNSDDTVHTITKGGVTRTLTYGANGIAGVA